MKNIYDDLSEDEKQVFRSEHRRYRLWLKFVQFINDHFSAKFAAWLITFY